MPVSLSFHNLNLKLNSTNNSSSNSSSNSKNSDSDSSHSVGIGSTESINTKYILKNVSGHVEPGSVLALMGPSGSGKTSLLNLLGGKVIKLSSNESIKSSSISNLSKSNSDSNLSGMVEMRQYKQEKISSESNPNSNDHGTVLSTHSINYHPYSKSLDLISLVEQYDDFGQGSLTCFEHLMFHASLRIQKKNDTNLKKSQQQNNEDRVTTILQRLRLTECKDTLLSQLSGGQKKRVSIAEELLNDPDLLLLDEPTSGLDSTVAREVVEILMDFNKQSKAGPGTNTNSKSSSNSTVTSGTSTSRGTTIIFTIHQPSSLVYSYFQNIMFLSKGEVVYFGKANELVDKLGQRYGFKCPQYYNGAEYAMDVIQDNGAEFALDVIQDEGQTMNNDENAESDEERQTQKVLQKGYVLEQMRQDTRREFMENHKNKSSIFQQNSTIKRQKLQAQSQGRQDFKLQIKSEEEHQPLLNLEQNLNNHDLDSSNDPSDSDPDSSRSTQTKFRLRIDKFGNQCHDDNDIINDSNNLNQNKENQNQILLKDSKSKNSSKTKKNPHTTELQSLLQSKPKPTWFHQYKILAHRTLLQRYRDQLHTRIALLTAFIVMSILGSLYFRLGSDPTILTPRTSALLLMITMPIFEETFNSGLPLVQSSSMINREYSTKRLYRLSAFYWARTTGEVPISIFIPLTYSILGFFLFGFFPDNNVYKLLELIGILMLAPLAAQSLGYLIGSMTKDFNIMIMLILCIQVPLFGLLPMFVQTSNIPVWIGWMRYFSIFNWTGRALCVWAWNGFDLVSQDGDKSKTISGRYDVLRDMFELDLDKDPYIMETSIAALIVMIIGFRILGWIRFSFRYKYGDNIKVVFGWKGD